MKYWTLKMIAEHVKRTPAYVGEAVKKNAVKCDRLSKTKGVRIEHPTADRFVAKQWPEAGPLPQ